MSAAAAYRRFAVALVAILWLVTCRACVACGACGAFLACRRAPTPVDASATARRVVSISASTTEALFAIGAGAQVVGRSRYCDWPPEVRSLPAVGGFVDPNLEAIVALRPDLVVGARGPLGAGIVRTLEEHGVATWFPETERLDQISTMIEGLGARTGHPAEARAVVDAIAVRRRAIETALATRARPRVLLLFAKKPISVAGPASFPDEMIAVAGGTNALLPPSARYPQLSLEKVLALDPDVIIDAEMGEASAPFDETWSRVRAVQTHRVVRVDDESILRPGPRIMDGVTRLAHAIHPEVSLP